MGLKPPIGRILPTLSAPVRPVPIAASRETEHDDEVFVPAPAPPRCLHDKDVPVDADEPVELTPVHRPTMGQWLDYDGQVHPSPVPPRHRYIGKKQ